MILLITLIIGIAVALVLIGCRALADTRATTDGAVEDRWIVDSVPGWLERSVRELDRRVIGGAVVGASFLLVFAAAAVVGWIFSGLDDSRGFARWDVAAAEFGRDNATDTSTRILDAITDLGGTALLVVVMVLLGISHAVRHSDFGPAWYLGSVGVGVTLLNNGLKLIIDRDRPDIAQLAGHAGSSFPSGHTAAAAACWAAIALIVVRHRGPGWRRIAAVVAVFIAGAVAATRVLLGVHWLTDVVAGLVVGWAWFAVVTVVFGGRRLVLGDPTRALASELAERDAEEEFESIGRRSPATTGDDRGRS